MVKGADGFPDSYWKELYADEESMDGLYNAEQHADYIRSVFASEFVEVGRIVDFGCGFGNLFSAIGLSIFPYEMVGLEPSEYAYQQACKRVVAPAETTELRIHQLDMFSWLRQEEEKRQSLEEFEPFDLGICTSVFQYLSNEELEKLLPLLFEQVRYLYFSVPLDTELSYQSKHLGLTDPYAIPRSKKEYREMLAPYFTVVSRRILESKYYFDEENTAFNDLLFRYD